jgi:NADP-reducing hydrogenase subunit HndD
MWKAVISDLNDLEKPIHCQPTSSVGGSVAKPLYAAASNHTTSKNLYDQVDHQQPPSSSLVARIPLQDCLSCTGCLTLAEEQLSLASRKHVVELCDSWLSQGQQILFSLQPQSIADIAVHFGIDYRVAAEKIAFVCKHSKGVAWVTDQKEARYFSLSQTWEELVQRYEAQSRLPLIISACPAWVSFMKRKRPEWVQLLSQVYSPALMAGYLWKSRNANVQKHVAVMSCYEMAVQTQTQAMEYGENKTLVDALWTTQQLVQWLGWNENKDEIASIPQSSLDYITDIDLEKDCCKGTSHGYFWMAVERWMYKLTSQQQRSSPPIEWDNQSQQQQVWIDWNEDGKSKRVGMILAYGFASLQRWMKRGFDSDVVLVEAMACPHGCVNGSGQLATQRKTPKEQREYIQSLVNKMNTNVAVDSYIDKDWSLSEWNSLEKQLFLACSHSNKTSFACPPKLYWNSNVTSHRDGMNGTRENLDW